jgi:putative ABC transport system permease protein
VLAAVGGVLGVPAAILLNRWVMSWGPIRPPYLFEVQVDVHAMAFAAIVTLVAGIACGLAPVARNASAAVWETLAGGRRAGGGPGKKRIGALLVAGELALSTALGIGTVLMAKSFLAQRLADHGYRVRDVVSLRLDLGAPGYREAGERATFLERMLERVAAVPGVAAVGATHRLPAGQGFSEARLEVEGVAVEPGAELPVAAQWVTPGYFEALAVPLLDGRGFTAGEIRDGAQVVMVSATLAERLWPGESALGRRLRPVGAGGAPTDGGRGEPDGDDAPWLRVIGTVGDVEPVESMVDSATPSRLHLYLPWTTSAAAGLTLVVHAPASAERVVDQVRETVRQVDPAVSVVETLSMADALDRDSWTSRIFSQLLGLYAAIAVAIALVGVYGLAADAVSGRTHELAVHMALGARRRQVMRMVMRQGIALGAVGIVTGLGLAFGLTRFVSAMFTGTSARDPAVFAGVALLFAVVTLLAIWLPARGVARIEPAAALRAE